jgi:hypothetical protein
VVQNIHKYMSNDSGNHLSIIYKVPSLKGLILFIDVENKITVLWTS